MGEHGEDEAGATVSLRAEVPEALLTAIRGFIERHPQWDQYRLFQAALAGFLVQNGVRDRGVTRCYLANLFPGQARFAAPPAPVSPTGSSAMAPSAAVPAAAVPSANTCGSSPVGDPFRLRSTPLQERTTPPMPEGRPAAGRRSPRILLRKGAGRWVALRRVA